MKHLYTSFLVAVLCLQGIAQVPRLINYQGIARDAVGAPITSTLIALKFEILQSSTPVFSETQTLNTNALGLFSTQIGSASGSNLNIDWENGAYKLQVYMDIHAGSNYTPVGVPQALASVPYALHAASVPASYSNNVLSIGTHTISLPTPTINGAGIASVTSDINTGANYTVTVPEPTLAVNGTSLSISNGNSVNLPQSMVTATSGIATISSAGSNSFDINVPAPQLSISGNSIISISNGNSIILPVALPETMVTANSGVANITSVGTNSFDINVPVAQLAINGNSLSIVGGNTVTLANVIPQTSVTASGIAAATSTISPGLNVFNVNVPPPTYNGSALAFGTNTVNIAPTLSLSGTTLYSGSPSNSVNLTSSNPWKVGTIAPNSVLLNVPGMPVGIGGSTMTSASALLDVEGTSATNGAIIKAINSNASNTFQILDIQNTAPNGLGMNIVAASTGDGAHFQAFNGYALHTQNNSAVNPAFYAKNNSNANGAYAGYFAGGFVTTGNGNTNSDFALKVQDNGTGQLFGVRNDGAIGVGSFGITPGVKLDVTGAVKINDGTQGNGKAFVSDATGKGSWKSSPAAISFGGLNVSSIIAGSSPAPLGTSSMSFTKQYDDTEVDIALYSNLSVDVFSGTVTSVMFEIYVDGLPSTTAGGLFNIKNQNTEVYANLRSIFSGLAAGSHSITIVAYTTGGGTCSGVLADSGGYSGKVIVKEIF